MWVRCSSNFACLCRPSAACRTSVRVSFLNNARELDQDILISSLPDFSFADQIFFFAASMIRRARRRYSTFWVEIQSNSVGRSRRSQIGFFHIFGHTLIPPKLFGRLGSNSHKISLLATRSRYYNFTSKFWRIPRAKAGVARFFFFTFLDTTLFFPSCLADWALIFTQNHYGENHYGDEVSEFQVEMQANSKNPTLRCQIVYFFKVYLVEVLSNTKNWQ